MWQTIRGLIRRALAAIAEWDRRQHMHPADAAANRAAGMLGRWDAPTLRPRPARPKRDARGRYLPQLAEAQRGVRRGARALWWRGRLTRKGKAALRAYAARLGGAPVTSWESQPWARTKRGRDLIPTDQPPLV